MQTLSEQFKSYSTSYHCIERIKKRINKPKHTNTNKLMASKKIRGFTLIEMLVTLSLSTVVVAFGYMAYDHMFSSYRQYEKMNEEISEITNCQRQIQKLFNRAELIDSKEKQLFFKSARASLIDVTFNDQCIVFRSENAAIDTSKCVVKSVKNYFGDKEISNGYIDKTEVEIELNKIIYNLSFEKLYDSERMMLIDSLNTFVH